MSTTTTTNSTTAFTNERDAQLWATARKSARLANTYGIKTTTVLARLAASRVMSGEDVGILATMVADDADMRAAGIKASSIRAYGAPLRRLAAVLTPSVYEALLMGEVSVGVSAADRWCRDASVTSAKINKALAGHEIDRAKLASRMAELIPSPDTDKGDANKGDANKSDANKGDANKGDANKGDANKGDANKGDANKGDANYGDALELFVDTAQVLLNMITRGKLSDGERRMLMRNVATVSAAFDAACAVVADK